MWAGPQAVAQAQPRGSPWIGSPNSSKLPGSWRPPRACMLGTRLASPRCSLFSLMLSHHRSQLWKFKAQLSLPQYPQGRKCQSWDPGSSRPPPKSSVHIMFVFDKLTTPEKPLWGWTARLCAGHMAGLGACLCGCVMTQASPVACALTLTGPRPNTALSMNDNMTAHGTAPCLSTLTLSS